MSHLLPDQLAAAARRGRAYLAQHGGRVRDLPDDPARQIDAFLIRTHDLLRKAEQAATLGLHVASIARRRDRLYRAGHIRKDERAGRRFTSLAQRQAICRLWAEGYSSEAIAQMRQVSVAVVTTIIAADQPARSPFYGRADIERIFSVGRSTVAYWVSRGWLPPAKSQPDARCSHHRWSRADLVTFVAERGVWPGYVPTMITDPELRRVAAAHRAAAGGRWWGLKEIRHALGVPDSTLHMWLGRGYLRGWPTVTYGGARFVWVLTGTALQR